MIRFVVAAAAAALPLHFLGDLAGMPLLICSLVCGAGVALLITR